MPDLRSTFVALAPQCDLAAALLSAVAGRKVSGPMEVRKICSCAGISQARVSDVQQLLCRLVGHGLFARRSELTWEPIQTALHEELAPMLRGAALYRDQVHRDLNHVEVVITRPPAPSLFNAKLLRSRGGGWGLVDTKEALPAIAEAARRRFCVMSPFVDDVGAPILINLFSCAPEGVTKTLITRADATGNLPLPLAAVATELRDLQVKVLSFRLERPDANGNEVSHAKVVLADDIMAYVGSLNMNRWSLEYSLEVGVRLHGEAAGDVARVVDVIEALSTLLALPERQRSP